MTSAASIAAGVAAAAVRLDGFVVTTPLVVADELSVGLGAEVRLKLESLQRTGSFKLRGAANALLCLPRGRAGRGVVAASSGNHGLGLATAARRLGVPVTVFVPRGAPASRRRAIAELGAEVQEHGTDCLETELHARSVAAATGRHYVSPYNDPDVVAGQGTVAAELLAQWPEVERIYVAVGGGGLLAGMAAYVKARSPGVEIVACSPSASPAMAECVRAGAIVDVACGPTLSDSTAGGVEAGAITFPLCRDLVDRWVEVDEPEIAAALLGALAGQRLLVEGAAAVALAACRRDAGRPARSAVVVCGGNVSLATLRELLGRA